MNGNGVSGERTLRADIPTECLVCGIKSDEWVKEHEGTPGWIAVNLLPGVTIFFCPNCSTPRGNTNIIENFKQVEAWTKEDADRRVALASGLIDPRTNRALSLVGGKG